MSTKASVTGVACAMLLWAGTALAIATPQDKCDFSRVKAWRVYLSCVGTVLAKDAGGIKLDEFAAFAKCRHAYFKKWTGFQSNAALATSTCRGSRLTDNGPTVTDNLTGLIWEKKTDDASVHDESNEYAWSASGTAADGTVFENFLAGRDCVSSCVPNFPVCSAFPAVCNDVGLNKSHFAGQADWRLPTIAELQTSQRDFVCRGVGTGPTCNCGSPPCIDAAFGPTAPNAYWSATTYAGNPSMAWVAGFSDGDVLFFGLKTSFDLSFARAVRGGF